ncbi:MAG: DUF3667 domain-containing protein [Candidatus Longimicrobiales bacterium M2_2A_002]
MTEDSQDGPRPSGDGDVETPSDTPEAAASETPADTPEGAGGEEPTPPPLRPGRRGRGTRAMDPERPCMNCGDPTPGEYCPTCGQRKVDVQVSVRTLLVDVMEDQFILDKRLPRTLKALFFRPGHMTVEHVNGRIVRYIHPFRLYLVTSLVFFLLLSFFSLRLVREATQGDVVGRAVTEMADSLGQEVTSLDSAIARIDRQVADTTNPRALRAALRATRNDLVARRAVLRVRQDSLAALPAVPDSLPGRAVEPDTAAQRPDDAARGERTIGENLGWEENPPTIRTGITVADSALSGQIRRLGGMTAGEAAETLVGTFFNYVPTLMFILLPVFAGVLKLLYIRNGRYYAEHFIFLLHAHSFVFILATIMLLLQSWGGAWLEGILGLWILVYIYLAMKKVYGQGWLITFAKYWTLGWMYFWILVSAIPIAFIATLFLF